MALVTVQRSPSNSNSSSTISDNECDTEERVKKQCESFFAVKGAALVLPRSNESRPIKKNPIVGELSDHIQSMFLLLRHEDRMTLAVRLESMYGERIRYIILVTCNGIQDTEESIILGVDIMTNTATIGLVLPIWCETTTQLDGDGGFNICTKNQTHTFKPVSVQALWSAMQAIHGGITTARANNYFPGGLHLTWIGYYESRINSSTSRVKEWQLMPELEVTKPHAFTPTYSEDGHYYPSDRELTEQLIFVKIKDIMASADLDTITSREVRLKLEAALGKSLRDYRHYLDEQLITYMRQMDSASMIFDHIYLGSEWNASHLEELERNGVGYILNVTMEIDNFYPNRFIYHNVRLYDIESSELLKYWDETYKFLSKAKEKGSKALVHCKMGISRSAATVIAYAMKEYNWPLEKARDFVSRKRKCVNPNDGFLQQLQVYEGMLDASRQRHNKLWRSKSESSLASSTECSQETIEPASSTEDISDGAPIITGTTPQTIAPKTTLPSPGLAPHTGHARRRSWSPKDSVAEAHFPSNVHNVPCKDRKGSLFKGVADVDFMMLDSDECQDIQIIVPEIMSPTSPTLSVPPESIVLHHPDDSETATLTMDIEGTSRPSEGDEDDPPVLKQVTMVSTLTVGESPSGFKDGIAEMTSSPQEHDGQHDMEASSSSTDVCEMSEDSELNTNNNSATGIESSEPIDDVPPPEGTVKLRVSSFENHQLGPEIDENPEVKRQEECISTEEGVYVEPEIPVSSGTVLKQKQDIEDRIKAKAAENESPPLTRSGKFPSDTVPPTSDSTTSKTDDTVSTDQQQSNVAEPHNFTKPETNVSPTAPSPLPNACLQQETSSTASPTLQALEKGRVKKITEQLLSQKSPTKDLESGDQHVTPERKDETDDSVYSPPSSPIKFALPDNKSSQNISTFSLKIEPTIVIPSQSVQDDTSQPQSSSEESAASPSKEAFVKTYFGEEIPLEPGTVKRQTIDFEQLSSSTLHEESENKKESDSKKDTPEVTQIPPESSYAEDMVVIIRDSTTNGKRKFEEEGSQHKYAKMDQMEADKESVVCEEDASCGKDDDQDVSGINSAYPEEGISSWKVGDVRKHTQQFEGLTTAELTDESVKPVVPVAVEEASCSKPTIDERGDIEQATSTPAGPGLSDGDSSSTSSGHIAEDVDHGSEALEEKKLKEVESIRERIEKLGLVSLRRTASIARISNERGSPVVLRRSDFSRPVTIKGNRSRSDSGTKSLESSPENPSQFGQGELTAEERRRSAHAKLVTPRPDSMPLQFYLEKPTSVEIRDLKSGEGSDSAKGNKGTETQKDCQLGSNKKKQQHGKSHPLSKLNPAL